MTDSWEIGTDYYSLVSRGNPTYFNLDGADYVRLSFLELGGSSVRFIAAMKADALRVAFATGYTPNMRDNLCSLALSFETLCSGDQAAGVFSELKNVPAGTTIKYLVEKLRKSKMEWNTLGKEKGIGRLCNPF